MLGVCATPPPTPHTHPPNNQATHPPAFRSGDGHSLLHRSLSSGMELAVSTEPRDSARCDRRSRPGVVLELCSLMDGELKRMAACTRLIAGGSLTGGPLMVRRRSPRGTLLAHVRLAGSPLTAGAPPSGRVVAAAEAIAAAGAGAATALAGAAGAAGAADAAAAPGLAAFVGAGRLGGGVLGPRPLGGGELAPPPPPPLPLLPSASVGLGGSTMGARRLLTGTLDTEATDTSFNDLALSMPRQALSSSS